MRSPLLLSALLASLAAPGAQPKDLKAFFERTCAKCHGVDGSARGPQGQRLPGRQLNDARWQAREKDSDLVKSILRGQGAMPGFKGQLTEEEAQHLVHDVLRPLAAKKR